MKYKFLIMLFLLGAMTSYTQSQSGKYKLRLDVYHQDDAVSINAGSLAVLDKINIRPGVSLSIERAWSETSKFRFYQNLKLGFYNNPYDERWWALGTDIGFEFKLFKRILLAPTVGVHYNMVWAADIQYEYKGDKWEQVKNTEPVMSRTQIVLGADIGYRLFDGAKPIDILINGNLSVVTPYLRDASFDLWAYNAVGIGLRMGI